MQMNKLIAVKTLELKNRESLKWNGFFDADTIRLSLGNNGSGETAFVVRTWQRYISALSLTRIFMMHRETLNCSTKQ